MREGRSLRLPLSPSYGFAAVIVLMHGVAAACFLTFLQGLAGLLLGISVLALGGAAAWDRALLRGGRAVRVIELCGDGSGSVESALGRRHRVAPDGRRAGRSWVIIGLQEASRRHLLVAADMLDAESFRRLRLWALWGRLARTGEGRAAA